MRRFFQDVRGNEWIWAALWLVSATAAVLGPTALPASAESVSLVPAKDSTLIQWSPRTPGANPILANARGDIFVSRTNQDGQEEATISIRRGLIQFNLEGAVPAGMTVTKVTLTMRDVMGRNGDPSVALHRVLQDWGEGTSFFNGGQGAPATDDDATWLHTFYNASNPAQSPTWDSPGGDFNPTASASSIIFDDLGGGQLFSWSSPEMVSDVQAWLADPLSNFGWMLIGDESRGQSAKRLNSRESTEFPNAPPLLEIEYAFAGDYNDDGVVNIADYIVWRSHLGAAITLDNETQTPGSVTEEDFDVWSANFGKGEPVATGSNSEAIPEPAATILVVLGFLSAAMCLRNR